jgi:hypothetical protein
MDLTLRRREEPLAPPHGRRTRVAAGPAGVLAASAGLSAAFVFAVSDLIARLG